MEATSRTPDAAPEDGLWEGPAIGLLDLDAFFASVEMLDHPEWRGKPVIVGGSSGKRGVVSTASYEARRYGVHSAMPSAEAERLCPDAIWVRGNYQRYREVSDQVMALIGDETPLVEQVSIDEAFFDVSPGRFSRESPVGICRRLQERVAALGVTCSIGLGTSKTVAKIASDMDKPRGLTVVLPGSEAEFLAPLPVRKMSGIGHSTEARLAKLGIRTLGQLAEADEEELLSEFGIMGPRMVERARGRERSQVAEKAAPDDTKSVSNERTFARDLTTEREVRRAIDYVCTLVGERLRRKGLKGRTVTLKVKYDATHARTAQEQLARPSDQEAAFAPVAQRLLAQIWEPGISVRLIGVGLSGFGPDGGRQLSLFDAAQGADDAAERSLSAARDEIRSRFGDAAIGYGRDLRLREESSDTTPMNKG
ncbi:MAG: DNA polymerase IV [Atopobiaceae bacterium]|jgi:DNA polymerase-4|nr:DNA polymerase IV [Atopobiaceae bacterium]MCH4119226.1 DNA polymerase IV [Atopobiaceae bacterium]MCI1317993.1 DNA polymerase IV [Atopobiaceae bacterium]MCI1388514.1 DNA polymerase IV [Atopobiaceae bacterium]MCI1432013.1 DNA polymerase IV [Atopobiaceae bacterium]